MGFLAIVTGDFVATAKNADFYLGHDFLWLADNSPEPADGIIQAAGYGFVDGLELCVFIA